MAIQINNQEARKTLASGNLVWVRYTNETLCKLKGLDAYKHKDSISLGIIPLNQIQECYQPENGDRIICTGRDEAICEYCRGQQPLGKVVLELNGVQDSSIKVPFVMIMNKYNKWSHYCKKQDKWFLSPESED